MAGVSAFFWSATANASPPYLCLRCLTRCRYSYTTLTTTLEIPHTHEPKGSQPISLYNSLISTALKSDWGKQNRISESTVVSFRNYSALLALAPSTCPRSLAHSSFRVICYLVRVLAAFRFLYVKRREPLYLGLPPVVIRHVLHASQSTSLRRPSSPPHSDAFLQPHLPPYALTRRSVKGWWGQGAGGLIALRCAALRRLLPVMDVMSDS
ncbi:hypothetical protein BJ546DRAFT_157613 [Cryomyces antarcticus]